MKNHESRQQSRIRKKSSRPPLICLTGIDGCGKSTQVDRLANRLRAESIDVATVWVGGRTYVSSPFVWLARRLLRAPRRGKNRRYTSRDTSQTPVSQEFSEYLSSANKLFNRSALLRRIWTDVSMLEHAFEARFAVWPRQRRGQLVLSDRYLYKSIVNLAVLLKLSPQQTTKLLDHLAHRIAPTPTLYFLIDVPAEVGFSRKDDLPSIEYVARRVEVYRLLADAAGMPIIDGTQPPDIIESQIWEIVSEVLKARKAERQSVMATDAN